jgi:hypothetical protein
LARRGFRSPWGLGITFIPTRPARTQLECPIDPIRIDTSREAPEAIAARLLAQLSA